jgi:3',5'-nucleoside bisphosphate phosphatase
MARIKEYNLHNHTIYSDGSLTPTEVVKYNAEAGHKIIAITDHNTIAGIKEAQMAGKRFGVAVVSGVEIDTPDGEILGLGIDVNNVELNKLLEQIQGLKELEFERVISSINRKGFRITFAELRRHFGHKDITDENLADYLVHKSKFETKKSALDFIKRLTNEISQSSGYKYKTEEIIKLVRAAHGLTILAHPIKKGASLREYYSLNKRFRRLRKIGLTGLETQHPDMGLSERLFTKLLATIHRATQSGGVDLHKINSRRIKTWTKFRTSKPVRQTARKLVRKG